MVDPGLGLGAPASLASTALKVASSAADSRPAHAASRRVRARNALQRATTGLGQRQHDRPSVARVGRPGQQPGGTERVGQAGHRGPRRAVDLGPPRGGWSPPRPARRTGTWVRSGVGRRHPPMARPGTGGPNGHDAGMAPAGYERLGPQGAASSTHYLGTATAMAVLARGGNAFDAAVAAGFVLQVVEPHLCGPGGEVPAVFVTASDPTPAGALRAGRAAGRGDLSRLRDELGLSIVPGTGLLAATVPGAWDGWLTLLRDHGTWSPGRGARTRARIRGRRVSAGPADPGDDRRGGRALPGALAQLGRDLAARRPGAAHRPPAAGAGRTWPGCWNRGPGRGEPGAAARRRPRRLVPRVRRRGDRRVLPDRRCATRPAATTPACSPPTTWPAGRRATSRRWSSRPAPAGRWPSPGPWSQGPVLAQQLELLLDGDVRYRDGVATAETVHRVTEAAKLAFADREAWYGDSAPVPLRRAALGGVRRRPAGADHEGVPGAAARLPGRAASPGCRTTSARPGAAAATAPAGPGSASRRSAGPARSAATPCTSTSWTRPAT